MNILDPLKLIVDVIKAGYQAATKMPRITCDIRGMYASRYGPDYLPSLSGNDIEAEGIEIETHIEILLSNSGGVDTTLKDIYVLCNSRGKKLGRLSCYFREAQDKFYDRDFAGIVIEPRRIWGPKTLKIQGSLWNIDKPPKNMKATLVVEVVSQRPIKKRVKFFFD
jgi:hypothetical protein